MNKTVLITGAAKGLGRSTAIEFAKNGFDIIFTYLNSEKEAQELKILLNTTYGVNVKAYKVNLLNDEDIDLLSKEVPSIDILVNNAAYNDDCNLFEKTSETFRDILRVNLIAPFLLSRAFYPTLKANNGSIVNVASTNGIDSMYTESLDYDASKAGLINLTKNLANAFAPDVRVNAVAPGWIDTECLLDMNPEFRKLEENKTLLNRFANPEEIAKCIYFISTEATYMTGSITRIDGGKRL